MSIIFFYNWLLKYEPFLNVNISFLVLYRITFRSSTQMVNQFVVDNAKD